jgi:hypothetical protein
MAKGLVLFRHGGRKEGPIKSWLQALRGDYCVVFSLLLAARRRALKCLRLLDIWERHAAGVTVQKGSSCPPCAPKLWDVRDWLCLARF